LGIAAKYDLGDLRATQKTLSTMPFGLVL